MSTKNWPLWEIFVRSKNGLEHRHCGSLHAADSDMALENARDVYTRRNEGNGIWIVKAEDIVSSEASDGEAFFEVTKNHISKFKVSSKSKLIDC